MKTNSSSLISLAFAGAIFCTMSAAHGAVVIESFESGTLNGWGAGTLNASATAVNTVRATDGAHSAANTFTVPASFSGWTVNTIMEIDPRTIMDGTATTLAMDVYSDWSNPNGWGVYGNTILLILNNSNGWSTVGPTTGSLANGSFQTLTWDMTSISGVITDSGLGYSTLSIAWHVGTWAGGGDGLTNGTQTFAIDNISITSVPEPSAVAALGAMGVMALLRRRRF